MNKERIRLMVKVCQLYFHEGLNQQEIARRCCISRPQVSRLISSAKFEGIVEVSIRNPFREETTIEKELMDHFHLRNAIIVDTNQGNDEAAFAQAGGNYLQEVIQDGDTVGVMAGKTIAAFVNEINHISKKEVQFVPLVGGWGPEGAYWDANAYTYQLAKKAKGKHWSLHAPAIVSSATMKATVMEEPQIRKVINIANHASVALVSVSEVSKEATLFSSTNMSEKDVYNIRREGGVASIGTSFLSKDGQEVGMSHSARLIGISGANLKNIPLVIGVAKGKAKVDAVLAALQGRWLHVLITDMVTAKELLEKHKNVGRYENEKI
ncbi:sugar-binding transcriptional regulator [Salirhabdus salicampi]|uniref:sugar-binding transcriptional regulator n=1 Tax=Salirhabdus salicampi TaxID=476102 RepID=UPI0020C4A1C8|nr:sugar-binding transcriptional regulator [Salirhabdus salicampi]MCP8617695.1 sugar-binding transcriptional regulator [Salirhabdus salicampi]